MSRRLSPVVDSFAALVIDLSASADFMTKGLFTLTLKCMEHARKVLVFLKKDYFVLFSLTNKGSSIFG